MGFQPPEPPSPQTVRPRVKQLTCHFSHHCGGSLPTRHVSEMRGVGTLPLKAQREDEEGERLGNDRHHRYSNTTATTQVRTTRLPSPSRCSESRGFSCKELKSQNTEGDTCRNAGLRVGALAKGTKAATTPPTSARDTQSRSTSAQPDERQPPAFTAKRGRRRAPEPQARLAKPAKKQRNDQRPRVAVADLKTRSGTFRCGYSQLQRRRSVNHTLLPQQQGKETR